MNLDGTKKFIKVGIPIKCTWDSYPPVYRFYVNGEMFTERSYRFDDGERSLIEILQILAEPGDYTIQFEQVSSHGRFDIGEKYIIAGPGNFERRDTLRIWDEN